MASFLTLTALYPEMEEATLGRWLVGEGETVVTGQPLVELITDKVAYEYASPFAGILLDILVPVKSVVPVGTKLASVGTQGEAVPDLEAVREENHRLAAVREETISTVTQAVGSTTSAAAVIETRVRATPAARRLARERGVDLANMQGTGPNGMITVEDIL